MIAFDDIKILMKEKSWKKLDALSVITMLLITVIVFFAAFELSRNSYLNQMEGYLDEIPKIIDSFQNELQNRSYVFEEEELTLAELGLKIFMEDNDLTDTEKLEEVRTAVSSASVSLLDSKKELLATTGSVTPEKNFSAVIKRLIPRQPELELYPEISEDGKLTGKDDGKGFVLVPVPGNTKNSLVFEFTCKPILEIHNEINDWANILERLIIKVDGSSAFAQTGDKLAGYPMEGYTPEQTAQLHDELTKVFQNNSSFQKSKNGLSDHIITLLGVKYLAGLIYYAPTNTNILLLFPLETVVRGVFFVAATISAIIGWGIVLVRLYIFRSLRREEVINGTDKISNKKVWQQTWPGIMVVVLVTILFSTMILMLVVRTDATQTAMSNRKALQNDIDFRKNEQKIIRSIYENFYRTRAQILTEFMMRHPDQQTHKNLEELNRIAGTEYLMRFDSKGQELVSSNSYTDFAVGKNLSEEYNAVLLGYPYVIVGPSEDPYTGKMQLGTAIMMTDREGQPDGFLLAVYSVERMNAELKQMSLENTVNTFPVQNSHIAAVIDDADGHFIAHTDPEMIGQKASDVIEDYASEWSFEGFGKYNGKDMCVSAKSTDGKTLIFMVPERWNSFKNAEALPMVMSVIVLLILSLVYYPKASVLIAQAIQEANNDLNPNAGKGSQIKIFYDGYEIFLTLFTFFVLIASSYGWWSTFDYVFSGKWSKGLNLFAVWASLLVLAGTLCIVLLLRTGLTIFEDHLSIRAKTVTSLIKSVVTYTAYIFLIFNILDMLGVNTTALLTSASIFSIAIGFGAKTMAEDLIAGLFLMTEGTIHVGDHVSIGNVTGQITKMGIRTIEITDDQGNIVTLNNSKITGVRNMSLKEENQLEPSTDPKTGS